MKTVGIIVEYNPLHYGHVYHFEQSKKAAAADAAIAVMSGHFLQRGEPAIINKWARTEMALRMGADVVIELPVAYSCQPAEWFAYGAVSILDATGVVDSLCFGSESGDIELLHRLAKLFSHEPEPFRQEIKQQLKRGINYPAAYTAAVDRFISLDHGDPELQRALAQPNNILGLHYLMALERLGSRIQPLTIARTKAGYHQTDITDKQIASATAIRRLLLEGRSLHKISSYVPPYTSEVLEREWKAGRAPMHWERFAIPLLQQLVSRPVDQLSNFYEVNEGLEHRIMQALPKLSSGDSEGVTIEKLLTLIKTKRYTRTKLQRTLLRILLQHTKEMLDTSRLSQGVPYLRVLGFSDKGRQLLKKMKKTAKAPIVTNVTREPSPFLEMDVRATSVYSLGYQTPAAGDLFRDYYQPPLTITRE
jgi:predicted nucleotidyltransferase